MKEILAASWGQAQAQVQQAGTIAWGSAATTNLPAMAGKVVYVALSILGLIFLGFALYAGFKWMTARGDEKEVVKAKDTIKNAVIGIVITASAYALTSFVMGQLNTITTGGQTQGDTDEGTPPCETCV